MAQIRMSRTSAEAPVTNPPATEPTTQPTMKVPTSNVAPIRYNTFVHTIPYESACASEVQVWLRTWYSVTSQPGHVVPSSFEEALSRVCLTGTAIRFLTQGAMTVHLRIVGIAADVAKDMAGDTSEAIKSEHDALEQLKNVSFFLSPFNISECEADNL
jgi:hypothetical protein